MMPIADHSCPGDCGAEVPFRLFACAGCWERLPRELRHAIVATYTRNLLVAHSHAMHDARRWYKANPVETPDVDG